MVIRLILQVLPPNESSHDTVAFHMSEPAHAHVDGSSRAQAALLVAREMSRMTLSYVIAMQGNEPNDPFICDSYARK